MVDKLITELSEDQFRIIHDMCKAQVYIILAPHNMSDDSEEKKNGHIKNLTLLNDLVKQGFMEDATDQFAELLAEARAKGKRTFNAFTLTETAVRMFTPPTGKEVLPS